VAFQNFAMSYGVEEQNIHADNDRFTNNTIINNAKTNIKAFYTVGSRPNTRMVRQIKDQKLDPLMQNVSIHLGPSSSHASSINLMMSRSTGIVFHVTFDN